MGLEPGLRTQPSISTASAAESTEATSEGEQHTAGEVKLPDGAEEGQRCSEDRARVLGRFNVGNTMGWGGRILRQG